MKSSALNTDKQEFTPDDIRYTTHDGKLYAIALGWPEDGELVAHTLYKGNPYLAVDRSAMSSCHRIAHAKLQWEQRGDGLHLQLPAQKPEADESAYVFRITPAPANNGCPSPATSPKTISDTEASPSQP